MSRHVSIPNEEFIHWLWANLHFDLSGLITTDGAELELLDTGIHNETDGPDFKQAHIRLDGLDIYGSIEIHKEEDEWFNHGHHSQPDYDQVILHVVLRCSNQKRPARRSDGTVIPTLELGPRLPGELNQLIHAFAQPKQLPCQHLIRYISEDAIEKQFDRAHSEYFNIKVKQLNRFYNPDLSVTKAWKEALVISLFDGLGISKNRVPMQQLAENALERCRQQAPAGDIDFREIVLQESGLFDKKEFTEGDLSWNRKGCRPPNRPKIRVEQAAKLAGQVLAVSPQKFLAVDIDKIWRSWFQFGKAPGRERRSILYGTVYLPAIYNLGELGHSRKLKKVAFNRWQQLRTPYPESLVQQFKKAGIPSSVYQKRLGAVHQMKRYCKQGKCNKCLLLKSAISS